MKVEGVDSSYTFHKIMESLGLDSSIRGIIPEFMHEK